MIHRRVGVRRPGIRLYPRWWVHPLSPTRHGTRFMSRPSVTLPWVTGPTLRFTLRDVQELVRVLSFPDNSSEIPTYLHRGYQGWGVILGPPSRPLGSGGEPEGDSGNLRQTGGVRVHTDSTKGRPNKDSCQWTRQLDFHRRPFGVRILNLGPECTTLGSSLFVSSRNLVPVVSVDLKCQVWLFRQGSPREPSPRTFPVSGL